VPAVAWHIHPDDKRFLMIAKKTSQPKINIIMNWFEELKEGVPGPDVLVY
jgi:hypothetical protein